MQAALLSSKGANPQGASVLIRRSRLFQSILLAVNAPLMVVAVGNVSANPAFDECNVFTVCYASQKLLASLMHHTSIMQQPLLQVNDSRFKHSMMLTSCALCGGFSRRAARQSVCMQMRFTVLPSSCGPQITYETPTSACDCDRMQR